MKQNKDKNDFFLLLQIGYKSNLRSSKSISDLSNIPEKDTSYMSGNQGNNCVRSDNPFYLNFPATSHIPLTGTNSIPELLGTNVPTVVPGVTGSYPELVSGCIPGFVGGSIPELGSNWLSTLGGSNADVRSEGVARIGSEVFDGSAVPRDQQKTGKQLLAQLERDLHEFDLLTGCPPSPPEVDTDSLEETLRSLSLLSSQQSQLGFSSRYRADSDSDSDTVKSEQSNFSCDSLEDEDDEDDPPEEKIEIPRPPVCEVPRTLPLPRRKRQRWQRLSLGGRTKERPKDYESDLFPTNELPSNSHSRVFRTTSDTALGHSDSSHSDVQTPTNPPYFSVKAPGHAATSKCITGSGNTHSMGKQPMDTVVSTVDDGNGSVTTVTVETHSYRLEGAAPVSYALPQSAAVEQLRRHSRESSPRRHIPKNQEVLPPGNLVQAEDFPVVQAQPLPPGPPPAVYLPSSQPTLPQGVIPAPGRAHRVLLAKKVTIQQVLPSKRKREPFCSAWLLLWHEE